MSQSLPIIINLLAAIVGAFGQYLYKIGASRLDTTALYQNWQIIIGAILFTVVMVMLIAGFKLGGRINVTYPAYATTFIWGTLLGVLIDKEPFSKFQLLGIVFVVIGISMIAYFSPDH